MTEPDSPSTPTRRRIRLVWLVTGAIVVAVVVGIVASQSPSTGDQATPRPTTTAQAGSQAPATIRGADPSNIYAGIGPEHMSPAVAGDLSRVYVPDGGADKVSVIDPSTGKVVDTWRTGRQPQHIVPSWDMRTLWLLDNSGNDLIPIDPRTGRHGPPVKVDDPYNLYFTPDGSSAIVVAEARHRLDFRDPHTMKLQSSLEVPGCKGINHADYSADGSYLLVTCEFAGSIAKIDMVNRRVVGLLTLGSPMSATQSGAATASMPGMTGAAAPSMPQDVRTGPDGHHFYVADMEAGGLHVIDGDSFTLVGFIHTGIGTHGITPSRDGTKLYVSNRGSIAVNGAPHGPGSVSVVDPKTDTVVANWPIAGGGSPDMGNLSADGTRLWLSGRFDSEVYAFDTTSGALVYRVAVARGPHGLTVWPQPGSFSLGHTGNMR